LDAATQAGYRPRRMQQLFQVNLRGIIELLSNHLYSGPHVFVRELLQNAVDAITARREQLGVPDDVEAAVRVVVQHGDGVPRIVFEDDGIGLTEAEIHQFLATLGESSKRRVDERGQALHSDLIGQFGIGLLACFLVSEEIVVLTRSRREAEAPCVEWRGRQDGTYSVAIVGDDSLKGGTRVSLAARADRSEWFEPARVRELLEHFGSLLRCPVYFQQERIDRMPPWRLERGDREALERAVIEFGRSCFAMDPMDWIPLRSQSGNVDGIAYVLPFAPNLAEPRRHRVYLKGMLVSDKSTEIVPTWAFFVQCAVDATRLRPTASREAFYEDDLLEAAREELGLCIRAWLLHLVKNEPRRLTNLIAVHHRAIKALAADDDDVLALFADFLPFETTRGTLSFAEIREQGGSVEHATSLDAFRQMAPLATAQGKLLVNSGYSFDQEVLARACALHSIPLSELDAATLSEELDDLSPSEQETTRPFLALAQEALGRFGCDVVLKEFRPEELTAFYATSRDVDFRRQLTRTREKTKGIWSSVLDSIASPTLGEERPILCLNHRNPLIRRLARIDDEEAVPYALELLYVHALLLGHQPLRATEQQLMPKAILGFIDWGLSLQGAGRLQ
jgi:molecular chaperone HtpG